MSASEVPASTTAADTTAADTMADGAVAATAAPAARVPLLARLRAAGYVLTGGLALSAIVHVALLGTVLVLTPRLLEPEPAKAVTVDLVTPEDLDKAAEKAKEEKTKAETPPPPQFPDITDKPQPPTQPQQAQPPRQPASAPQSASGAPPPPPPPPPQPALDAFAPPLAPSAAPAPSPPPAPPASGQAAQLAQLLGLPPPVAGLSGGPPSDYKANLSAEEISGFAAHLQGCWTPSPALAKAANLTLYVRVRLRRDGSLAAPPELLGGSASMQAFTLKELVMKALTKCPAYTSLPADKYDEWRVLDLHFTPNGISTAAPAPSSQRKPQRAG